MPENPMYDKMLEELQYLKLKLIKAESIIKAASKMHIDGNPKQIIDLANHYLNTVDHAK